MSSLGRWSALAALVALSLPAACRRPQSAAPPAPRDAARAPADAVADVARRVERAVDQRIAELDVRLAAQERSALQRADDWLTLEMLAIGYMNRARMSADYNDYARAEDALARAFQRASPGTGPILTRARFNYTVHRLNRVVPDLDALRYALLRPDEQASIAHLRAEVAFFSGRYDEARRLYEANLARERSVTNLVAMAQFQWKTNHYAEAGALVDEAARVGGDEDTAMRAWVALVRGTMEYDRGRYDAALAAFREGLRLQPDSWMFGEHIAEVLLRQGHVDEARLMYVDLVERTGDPEFVDAVAQTYERAHDEAAARPWVERARAAYEARLRIMPEATAGHAIEFFLRRDPARAVPVAELNRDARPGGEAQVKLAEAYLRANRAADARRVIDAVLATPWDTAETHAVAAAVYAALGDATRAAAERQRATAINPHALD